MRNLRASLYLLPILILSVLAILTAYQTDKRSTETLEWMKFMWISDSLGNQYFDRAYIYLPVEIQGIPHPFTFQFDLGAHQSLVYDASIEPYLALYPEIKQKLDTASGFPILNHVNLVIDSQKFKDRYLLLRKDDRNVLTLDSAKSHTVKHIGTIGADFFQNKVLIIDYQNERLAVTYQVPSDMASKASFVSMSLDRQGRINLPFTVNGKERKVMFDTGSSLFQLVTSPQNWSRVTSGQVTDSVLTSTWGEEYYVYGADINDIYLGNQKLPKATCYKNEYVADVLKEYGVWGVTGNAYFWNNIVVVDFVNKQFGWIR